MDVLSDYTPAFDEFFVDDNSSFGELVSSRDHSLHFLYQKVVNEGTKEAYADL